MKQRIKSALFFCLYYSGIEWLLTRILPVQAGAILMYHGVCDDSVLPREIDFHLPSKIFEAQMRALSRRYRIVSVAEIVEQLIRGKPVHKSVAITFDDGYRNNLTQALPILKRFHIPATIFVSTAFIGTDEWIPLNHVYWNWASGKLDSARMRELRMEVRKASISGRRRIIGSLKDPPRTSAADNSFAMLSWEEIQTLLSDEIDIGSHTHNHCSMAVEDSVSQQQELRTSRQLMEEKLKRKITLFAYPYGKAEQISNESRLNVISCGYDCALAAERGLVTTDSDRFRLPRIGYDKKMWMFTGELLYEFLRQAFKQSVPALASGLVAGMMGKTRG